LNTTPSTGKSGTSRIRSRRSQVTRARRPANARHENGVHSFGLIDQLEAWGADAALGGGTGQAWAASAWIGGDINRLWLRSEGERHGGITESADLEVLYGRSVSPWWDVVAGVRHDFKPGKGQDFAAIGVQGLAPYKFEVAATAYLGQGGQGALRVEAEYETLITNRLILQPTVELNAWARDDARRGIGAGLSTFDARLRLRHECHLRLAPSRGVRHGRAGYAGRLCRQRWRRADRSDIAGDTVDAAQRLETGWNEYGGKKNAAE